MNEMQFQYFYGSQAEQFSFYRLPKALITDPKFSGISSDAKILYGVMLDRMSLSIKNHWVDLKNRVYIIFTLEDVMETFACSERKASRLMNELDSRTGIGLLEKRRQGLGKPNIIYLKNFISEPGAAGASVHTESDMEDRQIQNGQIVQLQSCQNWQPCETEVPEENLESSLSLLQTPDEQLSDPQITSENQATSFHSDTQASSQSGQIWQLKTCTDKDDFASKESGSAESPYSGPQTCQIWQVKSCQKGLIQSCQNLPPNKTDNNYTDTSKTDSVHPSIYPSSASLTMSEYTQLIREHVEYDLLKQEYRYPEMAYLDELIELMAETLCIVKGPVKIGNRTYSPEVIQERLLRLDASHFRYVMDSLHKNRTSVRNIKAYLLAVLLNAPLTIDNAYRSQANHDLYAADE